LRSSLEAFQSVLDRFPHKLNQDALSFDAFVEFSNAEPLRLRIKSEGEGTPRG